MKRKLKHRHKKCGRCKQSIRVTKLFVIDPIDSEVVYHKQCWSLELNEARS